MSVAQVETLRVSFNRSTGLRESIGNGLIKIALKNISFAHDCSSWFIHSLMPIRPGNFGNYNSYPLELASRVAKCALAIISSPVALILWGASGLLELAADALNRRPYMYLKGCAVEVQQTAEKTKVMTLNACMFWGGLPIMFGGVRPAHERIQSVADLILGENPDVVLLQEMSTQPALELWEKIKHNYAHGYTRVSPQPWLAMDSALFIATKQPLISEPQYVHLPTNGTIRRGVFCLETERSWILTTHLEAGYDQVDVEERWVQVNQIQAQFNALKNLSNKPCVLMGDLNIQRTGEEYDEYTTSHLPELFHNPRDVAGRPFDLDDASATCTNELTAQVQGVQALRNTNEHIDYALVDRASKDRLPMTVRQVETYDLMNPFNALSDHKALIASF